MSSTLGKTAREMSNVFANATPVRREDAGPVAEVVDPPAVYATRGPVDDGDDLAAEPARTSTSVATRPKPAATQQPRRRAVAPAPARIEQRRGLTPAQRRSADTELRRYAAELRRLAERGDELVRVFADLDPHAAPGELRDAVRAAGLRPRDLPDSAAEYTQPAPDDDD